MTTSNATKKKRPSEEAAALALRERVHDFNKNVHTRSSLDNSDLAALTAIGEQAATYRQAAMSAWHDTASPIDGRRQTAPSVIDEVVAAARGFVTTATATVTLDLGAAGEIRPPAIESPQVRVVLQRQGDALLARIDAAIEAGVERVASHVAAQRDLEERVSYWLRFPAIRSLTAALIQIIDDPEYNEIYGAAVPNAIGDLIRTVQNRNKTSEQEPLLGGYWNYWVPVARPILAASGSVLPEAPAQRRVGSTATTPTALLRSDAPGPVAASEYTEPGLYETEVVDGRFKSNNYAERRTA